jgi:hypothetical protein
LVLQTIAAGENEISEDSLKFARLAAFLTCFCWLFVASAIVLARDSQIDDNRRMRLQSERETQKYQITMNTPPIEERQQRRGASEAKT